MASVDDFMECPCCIIKPGSPVLCASCRKNRALIRDLQEDLEATKAQAWDERVAKTKLEEELRIMTIARNILWVAVLLALGLAWSPF